MASTAIGSTIAGVAALESLVLINKHAFLPAMEYATKSLYGALGEDPLRTAQELEYAWHTYFEPVFNFVENINTELKNKVEEATGLDLDRDGGVGAVQKIQENGDRGTGVEVVLNVDKTHSGKGSGTIKVSDAEEGNIKIPYLEWVRNKIKDSPHYDEQLFNFLTAGTDGSITSFVTQEIK